MRLEISVLVVVYLLLARRRAQSTGGVAPFVPASAVLAPLKSTRRAVLRGRLRGLVGAASLRLGLRVLVVESTLLVGHRAESPGEVAPAVPANGALAILLGVPCAAAVVRLRGMFLLGMSLLLTGLLAAPAPPLAKPRIRDHVAARTRSSAWALTSDLGFHSRRHPQ